ncbi:D-alanine--D-alanine ligase [Flavobacteriaceae bacterium UJ101]|nr:D-alanine--D-alanine ligase [Flavobacteriaceae bacterium UJ101]
MKKNIAVLMGGYTDESVISLKSGQVVYDHIDQEKYNVYKVHILNEGWYALVNEQKYSIDKGDFSFDFDNEKIVFDAVFNIIHGTPGEDGNIQAYFDILGIKHTSCPFYQSALTFNKKDSLAVLNSYGIPSAESYFLHHGDPISLEKIIKKVGIPCFVKPNKSGSSLGASKVTKKEDLAKAISYAFQEDDEVIIETFLDGVEVSVGVVDYKGETQVLGITEIVTENDFFDYAAKYEGQSEEITPARLSEQEEQEVRRVAKKAYEIIKMKGLSRSEYILVDGVPHFIEMNTNPGMSLQSILPQQVKIAGISLNDLFEDMIQNALNS